MERKVHFDGTSIIDTVSYSQADIDTFARYADAKRASGQHTANDVYELATVSGELIEAWCHQRGITWPAFVNDRDIQTEFINSDYAKPFRVWRGKF